MAKLKEIKNKSEDTGSKARQYLEGLLKIPYSQRIREGNNRVKEKRERKREEDKKILFEKGIQQLFAARPYKNNLNNNSKKTSSDILIGYSYSPREAKGNKKKSRKGRKLRSKNKTKRVKRSKK
jgi:hypothetical protein